MITLAPRRTSLLALSSVVLGLALASASSPPGAIAGIPPTAGQVLSFGDNSKGELGLGGPVDSNAHPTPAALTLPSGSPAIVDTALGGQFSILLDAAGTVYVFGSNAAGQLGDGFLSSTPVTTPRVLAIPGVNGKIIAIAAGTYSGLAMSSSGQVFGWGNNQSGQLGNSTGNGTGMANKPTPITLPPAAGTATAIAEGQLFTLVTTSTGAVYAFGDNYAGELGNSTNTATSNPNPTPALVPLPSGAFATGVAAGQQASYVTTRSGPVYSVGENSYGELGRSTGGATSSSAPAAFGLPTGVTGRQAAAGNGFALVLGSNGTVYGAGSNSQGQLGIDSVGSQTVTPLAAKLPPGGAQPLAIAASGSDGYVLLNTGAIYSFGRGTEGELGDTTTTGRQQAPTLVQPPAGTTFEEIGTGQGGSHAFAIVSDLAVATAALPGGQVGDAYPALGLAATGGVAPYTWAAQGLPAGLILSAAGQLSGTPTSPGSSTVAISVTDAKGILSTRSATIAVTPAAVVTPPATTPPATTRPGPTPIVANPITAPAGPSVRAIVGSLLANLVPKGKSAAFATLFKKGYAQSVTVLESGKLRVTWSYQPPKARGAKKAPRLVTVATGSAVFTKTGLSHVRVTLTRAGTALLKAGHKVGITFRVAFSHGTDKLTGGKSAKLS